MKPTFPLDPVVRIAPPGEAKDPKDVEVFVNTKGEVLDRKPIFSRVTRYFVRPETEFELQNRDVSVRDIVNNQTVKLYYRCSGYIIRGREREAVGALWDASKPVSGKLEELIQDAVTDWWRNTGRGARLEAGIAVHQRRGDIMAHVTQFLQVRGIHVDMVTLVEDGFGLPLQFGPISFQVRVSDYPEEELPFEIQFELQAVPETRSASAPLPEKDRLIDQAKEVARECFRTLLTLHRYYHDVELVSATIRDALTARFTHYGWRCSWVVCRTGVPDLKGLEYIDVQYDWPSLDNRKVPFSVRLEVGMEPDGIALYKRAEKPELKPWFRKVLDEETHRLLLLDEFKKLTPGQAGAMQLSLQRAVQARAKAIGLSLRALVLTSELPEWKYLTDFSVDVTNGRYTSKLPDLDIHFDMFITGCFATREDLKTLMTPDDHVVASIQATAREAAAFISRIFEVEDYLNRFERATDAADTSTAPFVRDQICKHVTDVLASRLKFKVTSCVILQRDEDLINFVGKFSRAQDKRFQGLIAVPSDRQFPSETYPVEFVVRLYGIKPATTLMLHRKQMTPEDLWNRISEWAQVELDSSSREDFLAFTAAKDDPLRVRLKDVLCANSLEFFGAQMDLMHLRVDKRDFVVLADPDKAVEYEERYSDFQIAIQNSIERRRDQVAAIKHLGNVGDEQRAGERERARTIEAQRNRAISEAHPDSFTPDDASLGEQGGQLYQEAQARIQRKSSSGRLSQPRPKPRAPEKKKPENGDEDAEPEAF